MRETHQTIPKGLDTGQKFSPQMDQYYMILLNGQVSLALDQRAYVTLQF